MNLQHFTPTTLEAMYRDLDESRLDLLCQTTEENFWQITDDYHKLMNELEAIDKVYEAITGTPLWVEVYAVV